MTEHFNELSQHLNNLGRRHDLSTVFNDFVTMAICSYHRTNLQTRLQEKDPENEKLYLHTIAKYDVMEINTFPKALAMLQMHLYDHPYSDPLGDYYMAHISNGRNGEYFTPEPVCDLMTRLNGGKETIKQETIYDPACGSGRMLLSFAKQNLDNYFYGSDVSLSCARMATVNFFLNGLRGEVAWMNTLSMEWYGGWKINTLGLGIVPIAKEQSRIWSPPPKRPGPPSLPSEDPNSESPGRGLQLGLF